MTTVVKLLDETPGVGRLGRHVEHDPRSRNFPVKLRVRLRAVEWTRHGEPFDQGNVGSCTGNAAAGILNTDPFYSPDRPLQTERDAVAIYQKATTWDRIPGEYPPDDTGSSGLAVARVLKADGFIARYHHAFTPHAAISALMFGPTMIGAPWYEGFDNPDPRGRVAIAGTVRGGHEFEATGYEPDGETWLDGWVKCWNSWGSGWGAGGAFYLTARTLATLMDQQGDVTVPLAA